MTPICHYIYEPQYLVSTIATRPHYQSVEKAVLGFFNCRLAKDASANLTIFLVLSELVKPGGTSLCRASPFFNGLLSDPAGGDAGYPGVRGDLLQPPEKTEKTRLSFPRRLRAPVLSNAKSCVGFSCPLLTTNLKPHRTRVPFGSDSNYPPIFT